MCRSSERAIMVHVESHPDSRSRAVWSTAFDGAGQGSLFSDVHSFADDHDGRLQLVEHIVAELTGWTLAGFGVSVGSDDDVF
jgi:hypothetical protein